MTAQPLAGLSSLKVKLGVLVAASVTVAAVVGTVGRVAGVAFWLSIPVTIALALALTQLLAVGMVAPLRQMTAAARRMATGDYDVRVDATSRAEVGELARAFNTMAQDLAEVDRQRRELVANVSHELRTPLAGLTAVLENLADGVAPPDPDYLAAPLAQAERMGRLVEDLLDLARVDAGRAPLSPEPVAVAPLLADAVAAPREDGRAVRFDVRVEPTDLVVHADPARLHQLVGNLLDNAARHSPAHGTVLLTAERHADRWWLEVHDEGPGVAPEDRERVFERFGTLGVRSGGGTGLGLAIARWVSDLHGGSIDFLDPAPGGDGAHVRVDLPLDPPDRPETLQENVMDQRTPPVTIVPAERPAPTSAQPAVVPAPSLLGEVFGGFWPERDVPARPGVLLGALGVGVLAGVVLPFRDLGLALTLVLLAAGGVVLAASRHRRDPFTLTACAGCGLLALTPVLRAAEWLVVLSLLAGAALCMIAVTRGRTLPGFLLAGVSWPLAGLRGLPWLGRTLGGLTGLGRQAAVWRTLVWSVLALVVFGALFASADALLAEWVDALVPDLRVDTAVARVFIGIAVGGAVLAAAYLALNPPQVESRRSTTRGTARRFEWLAPVLVVNAVFAAFLVAQATVIFGGHDYLRRTTGLTYADYVHQGFGQLTVATALTLLVVALTARKAAAADRAWMLGSLGLLLAQTLVVVASALHRVDLYQEAYGFTRLRLLVVVFEGWLGLLVLAVVVAGLVSWGIWLPRFAVASGVVALLGLVALNPDAWIADRNLDRYAETGRVDWYYLQGLSDDAVPTLAERPAEQAACALAFRAAPEGDWLEWNLGRSRAAEALPATHLTPEQTEALCPERG